MSCEVRISGPTCGNPRFNRLRANDPHKGGAVVALPVLRLPVILIKLIAGPTGGTFDLERLRERGRGLRPPPDRFLLHAVVLRDIPLLRYRSVSVPPATDEISQTAFFSSAAGGAAPSTEVDMPSSTSMRVDLAGA